MLSDELDFSKSEAAPKKLKRKKKLLNKSAIEVDFTARKRNRNAEIQMDSCRDIDGFFGLMLDNLLQLLV